MTGVAQSRSPRIAATQSAPDGRSGLAGASIRGRLQRTRGESPIVALLADVGARCEVTFLDGRTVLLGEPPADFRVTFRAERALRLPTTEWALGHAYMTGQIDLDGDILAVLGLRDHLRYGMPIGAASKFLADLVLRSPVKVNKSAIHEHYTLGDDFYLTFIDSRYRFYSHCVFERDDESLEEAAEHKLESMWNALGLAPGMRLLDIGGGWGGVAEYCSARGVHVTSVTLVADSAAYINRLIAERGLDADVVLSDFLEFVPDEPFDHAVIYGVIEHIPNYARFCAKVWNSLPPGGRLYLDASATKQKFAVSPITRVYTWPGHHSFLAVQDMIQELLFSGFELVEVKRETRDYELTITHWAERFENAREAIVAGWSEELYRAFRIFLWGGAHAFRTNRLQAYHLVAERRADPGPRPGVLRRTAGYLASLA